jgi:PST family polysaccharide transporter
MSLVKTSLLNGLAVTVKVACSVLLNKILAVYVGPSGYAVIGQFQNAVSIIVNLAGGAVAVGVTKATAQHFDDQAKQHEVWQTAIRLSLTASLLATICILFFGGDLSNWLLHRPDMSTIFIWLAVSLPAMAANSILLGIVNGKKEIAIYIIANIAGSLISLLIIGLLTLYFGLYGALVAFTINPAIVLISTAIMVSQRTWFKAEFLWGHINRPALQELSGFALMGLFSALAAPITYMLIRDNLTSALGFNAAGYWQASWKISEIYMMLVTTTLSVYYLPRIAEIRTAYELKTEIIKVYRFVLPIVILGAGTIFLMRDFIIHSLFTPDFLPMRELFQWQVTGDVIKICSWILSFITLGRGMVKPFVLTELTFSISFYFFSFVLVERFGLIGVSMAYAINYALYLAAMVLLVNGEMKKMTKASVSKDLTIQNEAK